MSGAYTDENIHTFKTMATWFYYNDNGDKISVTGGQLKLLAENGHITPKTIIENANGKQSVAGKVKGLTFAETLPDWIHEKTLPTPLPSVPIPPVKASPRPSIKDRPAANVSFVGKEGNLMGVAPPATSVPDNQVGWRYARGCLFILLGSVFVGILLGMSGLVGEEVIGIFVGIPFIIFCLLILIALVRVIIVPLFSPIADSMTAKERSTVDTLVIYFRKYRTFTVVGLLLCLILIGIPFLITGLVYNMMLLYQLWKLIPKDIARTTPSKAVGYNFIPIFGFYWIFVSYVGLAEDMNKMLREHGVQYQVNEGLGVTLCIFWVIGIFLPPLLIVVLIMSIYFFESVTNGAMALLE